MTALLDLPPDWRYRAACGGRCDDLFFPVGDSPASRAQTAQAKAICKACPVREECLAWAMDTCQDAGVWGGKDEQERRTIRRRQRGHTVTTRAPHGTATRYNTGCKCQPCKSAHAAAALRSRKRRRERPA